MSHRKIIENLQPDSLLRYDLPNRGKAYMFVQSVKEEEIQGAVIFPNGEISRGSYSIERVLKRQNLEVAISDWKSLDEYSKIFTKD